MKKSKRIVKKVSRRKHKDWMRFVPHFLFLFVLAVGATAVHRWMHGNARLPASVDSAAELPWMNFNHPHGKAAD